jgi:mutator protein MutT
MNHKYSDATIRIRIAANLNKFKSIQIDDPNLRHAAVAIVVIADIDKHDSHSILLTLRTSHLKQHSGQYALPGGKLDPGETPVEAALRELREELGISLDTENLLGQLDDYPTRSGFRISPIVFWADSNVSIIPSPHEVEKVFRIPFNELDSDAIPLFEPGKENGSQIVCSQFPTLGHRMYSPTAAIIFQFREVAIRGAATRVAHFDQPNFAWS